MKDMMNQLVDCKIDKMMENHMTEEDLLESHMTETALPENHILMAVGPDYMRAVALLTHKMVVNQNYMTRELGCSLELERTRMRVMALLIENYKIQ